MPAGPPPPDSWINSRRRTANDGHRERHEGGPRHTVCPVSKSAGGLPGLRLPDDGSLLHLAMKALALDWTFHKEYDQFYLATLPVRQKEAILSYIARYNPHAFDRQGLEVLFLDNTELEDATGGDSLTHLDLTSILGNGIGPKDLKSVFSNSKAEPKDKISLPVADIPESWDSSPHESSMLSARVLLPRFPALTHLSLSHPVVPSWKNLLAITPYLATLTHLSLAYWPTPSLMPNSTTAYRETPSGNVDYGGSNFYSVFDGNLSEAASVLRRLSKATYCLQWLDVTGCSDWVQALGRKDGPDWCGAWRGVDTVRVEQASLPGCLEEEGSEWRQVVEVVSVDDGQTPTIWARKKELVAWANIEKHIGNVERNVRLIISQAKRSSTDDLKIGNRQTTVKFDRGWHGWWIEDALEYFNLANSNSQMFFRPGG